MPRPVDQARTRRAQVAETANVSRLSVVAQNPGAGNAGNTAKQLSSALGLAGDVYENENNRRDESYRLAGERDFNLGNVNEELQDSNDAYNKAVTQNEAEAGWIQDVDEFDQALREVDLESLEPEQQVEALNASINELYQRKYQGLDDPDQAEILAPRMEKYRQAKTEELLESQRAIAEERIDSNLQTVVRGYTATSLEAAREADPEAPDHELTASAGFDYLGLHARVRALKPGGETNETYFAILKDLAIRNGDPELLTNIPDRWADGTPSFKAIPGYNDKILAAEQQAANVRAANAKAYDKALADQRDALEEQTANRGYEQALSGVDPTAWLLDEVREGRLKGKTANSIVQSYRSAQEYDANSTSDPGALVTLQTRVLSEPDSVTNAEIHEAWAAGAFGDPKQPESVEALRAMIKDRDSAKTAGKSISSNPRAKSKVDQFKQSFSPKADPITGSLFAPNAERALYAESLDELNQKLAAGEDPSKAYDEVQKQYLDRIARIQSIDNSGPDDAAGTVELVVRGDYSAEDAIRNTRAKRIPDDVAANEFIRAEEAGSLSTEQLEQLLDRLGY